MVHRQYWINRLEQAWQRRSVVWLSGVRRVGKPFLCQSLPGIEYFDCEFPRVRRLLEDPQAFLADLRGQRIVLDEVHRLERPSEILKIAADHYPDTRIVATGSSTLGASSKFRDTLAGRKAEVWLTPMIAADLAAFGRTDLQHRFLHGGLPSFFLADVLLEREFQEWMDAYWAKDVFVCYHRGWDTLRREELGWLWEHFVLNEMQAHVQSRTVHYWRDKRGHEVDFVLARRGKPPLAIECKWSASEFDPASLKAFKRGYPQGESVVVAQDVERPFSRPYGDVSVRFMPLRGVIAELTENTPAVVT